MSYDHATEPDADQFRERIAGVPGRGQRLTPAIVRLQEKPVVIQNFEQAIRTLRNRDTGAMVVLPATYQRALKQWRLCKNELIRRHVDHADLNYRPGVNITNE